MAKKAIETFDEEYSTEDIKVTILEALGNKRLTKRFHPGGCEQFSLAKYFTHKEATISDFDALVGLLRDLEADPTKMIVVGSVRAEFTNDQRIVRRLNSTKEEPATLEDSGSYLLHFDVDDVSSPDHIGWNDPEALAKWTWDRICNRLPAMQKVSVFWQASASAATEGKEHLAKFHFWILADRPLRAYERKHLFKTVGSDQRLASPAQPNYVARPVFDGITDPLEDLPRSGVFEKAKACLGTTSINFPSPPKPKTELARENQPRQGKASKPSAVRDNQRTSKAGQTVLLASCQKIESSNTGNTKIYNEAQLIGGYVAGGEIGYEFALGALLYSAAKSGHARFCEAVKNGFEAGLKRPLRANGSLEALEPFFKAPTIERQAAIALHSKTILSWVRKAKEFNSNASKGLESQGVPPRYLLSGAMGVGKTSTLVGRRGVAGALHQTQGLVTLMLLPDHDKVSEALEDYCKNALENSPPAIGLLGRNRPDPVSTDQGTKMCHAHDSAAVLSQAGLSIRSTICPRCPLKDSCGYMRQERAIEGYLKAEKGLVIFAAHEYAYLPLPGEAVPHLVIFDERPRDFSVKATEVSYSELVDKILPARQPIYVSDEARSIQVCEAFLEQERAINPIKNALLKTAGASAEVSLRALRNEGVTKNLLETAIEDLERFTKSSLYSQVAYSMDSAQEGNATSWSASIKRNLANHPALLARRMQQLFRGLASEIESENENCASVFKISTGAGYSKTEPGFAVSAVNELKHGLTQPFLHLDGTADPDLCRIAFGQNLTHHYYPVERNAQVTQVLGCNFAKRRLCKQQFKKQALTDKQINENNALREHVNQVIARRPSAAVFASKAIVESLEIDDPTRFGHFGKLRGQNRWENREEVVVVGREQPPLAGVEEKARAYASAAGSTFTSSDFVQIPRAIRTTGDPTVLKVSAHVDPWGDRILRQIREAEVEQAIDRIRLTYNEEPKQVFLLSPVVINATVEKVVEWREFKKGGSRIERAIETYGLLFLSPRDCARYMSEIWTNPQTASIDLHRAKLMSDSPCSLYLHGKFDDKSPRIIEFWPGVSKNQRSRKKKALYYGSRKDISASLDKLVGEVQRISVAGK